MTSKSIVAFAFTLTAMAWPAFGQQGETKTTCSAVGNDLECTTKHEPTSDEKYREYRDMFSFPKRNSNRPASVAPPQPSPEAVKAAEERAERHTKFVIDYIYCRQHLDATVKTPNGQPRTCTEVIQYTKIYCTTEPSEYVCTLARSRAEVEKSFADLEENFRTDPRRNKKDVQMFYQAEFAKRSKWGCMSYPDMILPKWGGGTYPCPDAPGPSAQTR